jgi:uncharacterized protein (TIGR01777 family)
MNTHLIALQLMAMQGLLGAFDTIYHHELTETLPQRFSARKELGIHSLRALIYCGLFIGLSAWEWHGFWSVLLLLVFGVEIFLTLWDFVIEDKTRLLPPTERVIHTILAMNGGAFIALLGLNTPLWLGQESALVWHEHGFLSHFLALCGVGVGLSGIRDGLAFFQLGKIQMKLQDQAPLHFSDVSESVLVTGGTGFIGQLLVRALLADNQRVTVLSRDAKRTAWLFDGKVTCIESMTELDKTQRIDVIINLAGARILGWRWTKARQAALRRSRVTLTNSVVDWIREAQTKPRLLCSASAIGYYGVQARRDQKSLDESSPSQNIFMSTLCQEWESAAERASEYGVRVCCMRFGLVLGQQGALPMMLLPIKLGIGGALGGGDQWHSWIHVQDLLRGIAHLWAQSKNSDNSVQDNSPLPEGGAYNFTAPESVTQKQFSQVAAKLLHRPCFISTPAFPIRLMLGEQADLLLEGQRVAPARLLQEGFSFRYPTLHEALENLL